MKGTYTYDIKFKDIKLEKSEISSFMGLTAVPDEPFNSMIDVAMELLSDNENIEGGFVVLPVEEIRIKDGQIKIGEQIFETGKMISSFLKKSEYAAIFTCTAGPEVEQLSKRFTREGDFVQSYVIDSAGSLLVEGAMDLIYEALKRMASQNNLNITNRYSPGYCNWKVVDQQKLFSMLPERFCNISLSESSLMSPVKSISGIVGIGQNVKRLGYICDTCNSKNCVYRAKKMYVKH